MTASPAPVGSPWILSPARDLLLFIATPLLILPAMLVAQQGFASRDIQYFVLAFGAMGHTLPGMMRAYGDRALFRRFRTRFIVSPILIAAVTFALTWKQSKGIGLIAYTWGVWHALMQVYGFLRIYDGKARVRAVRNASLDFYLCLAWFVGGVLFSDSRVDYMQQMTADFGLAPLSAGGVAALRAAVGVGIGLVTAAYVWNQVAQLRAGQPFSAPKTLLIGTSVLFWWYANVAATDILIGLILFEIFHDVQYLTIVWLFNRRRVDTDPGVGAFTRFVFRRSWGMLGIYVGLVFVYGGFQPLSGALGFVSTDLGAAITATVVTTSALLHFYFDGFIWKVRERATRESLGLDGAAGAPERRVPRHALKWLFFLVPAGVMLAAEESGPSLTKAQALVESTPNSADAQYRLAVELNKTGRYADAIPILQRTLTLYPAHDKAPMDLAIARLEAGKQALRDQRPAVAEPLLEAANAAGAIRVAGGTFPDAATLAFAQGYQLREAGQHDEAIVHFRAVLLLQPDMAAAHLNLALEYRDTGQRELALRHARRGASLRPGDERARALVASLAGR